MFTLNSGNSDAGLSRIHGQFTTGATRTGDRQLRRRASWTQSAARPIASGCRQSPTARRRTDIQPAPEAIFRAENRDAPATITPLREKIHALSRCHLDEVIIARFNQTIANLSAEDFIKKILVDTLHVEWLMVGEA